jgi:transposase InsO family protein
MHKNTKLTPNLRREIYVIWLKGGHTLRGLGKKYHVDKNVIDKVIIRGRLGDFSVHDSCNHRYRTIEYGLKRLSKTERFLEAKNLAKNRHPRYEKSFPGEMIHGDTKRLPAVKMPTRFKKRREVLFVAIDDASRYLFADILPDRTAWSSATFFETAIVRLPFAVECHYSDNGGEYRGGQDHPFRAFCLRHGIQQKFTKPFHPFTNGKAERVIRTILSEWLRITTFTSYEQRRQSLYQFVDWYNHERHHMGINNQTPAERLASLLEKIGDNA